MTTTKLGLAQSINDFVELQSSLREDLSEKVLEVLSSGDKSQCLWMMGELLFDGLQTMPELPGWLALLRHRAKQLDQK